MKKLLVEIVKGIQLKSVNPKSVSSFVVTTARRVCLSARGSELIAQASDAGAITRDFVVGCNRSVPNVQLRSFRAPPLRGGQGESMVCSQVPK